MTAENVTAPRACAICGSTHIRPYFHLRNSPRLQNVLYDSAAAAQAVEATDALFWVCESCLYLFNPGFREAEYSAEYNNDQSHSQAYRAHLGEVVELLRRHLQPAQRVVEIGCGNGLVLSMLSDAGFARVEGFDPAHAGSLPYVRAEYWRAGGGNFDALILRHTLEGLADYRPLLNAALAELSANGVVYLELTNARSILERANTVLLYHEYPQYFSEIAIGRLLADAGFYIHEFRQFAGGELLGIIARRIHLRAPRDADMTRLGVFGNACIWGVAGRTIHFLTHNSIGPGQVRFAVDVDPRKQGRFIPRTGQQIVSPEECVRRRPDAVIVLNERYVREVAAQFPYAITILTDRDFHDE